MSPKPKKAREIFLGNMQNSIKEVTRYLSPRELEPQNSNVGLEVFSFAQYAERLRLAHLPDQTVRTQIDRIPIGRDPDVRALELTRGALRQIAQAKRVGIDPSPYVTRAAKVALVERRTKVGPFGGLKVFFEDLGNAVNNNKRFRRKNF